MRREIMQYIKGDEQLLQFIRTHPKWYRQLGRNPHEFRKFEINALNYYKKTIPHKVERFANGAQMATMLFNMFQAMNN